MGLGIGTDSLKTAVDRVSSHDQTELPPAKVGGLMVVNVGLKSFRIQL